MNQLNAIQIEVLNHALAGITEEMMVSLVRGAHSPNIKERKDCSTALFDPQARVIAQAQAIPVHLGALGDAVQAVQAMNPMPGEVYVLNDPFQGGSHLPDLTLVTVVAGSTLDREKEILGFTVSRAHHSDVGGMRPGSMPADSTEIYQEGIVIPPTLIAQETEIDENVLRLILANVRQPHQRRADLQAQIAANHLGALRFQGLARLTEDFQNALEELMAYAERRFRASIEHLGTGQYHAEDFLESPANPTALIPLKVAVTLEKDHILVDFTGTAEQIQGNLNAPLAVTRSAVYFALRALIDPDLPLNEGAYRPITLIAPPKSLVNAQRPSAVVAGNVETSQRICDLIFLALAPVANMAQGQGTMNNLILGNQHFSYYETIGGGQGASAWGPGLDGVHVGMSNTLNTPIEALELEYPLRMERYELREGSGGAGIHAGGLGIIRELTVLEDCTLSLLSERRKLAPQGVSGGKPGAKGVNLLDGQPLPGKVSMQLRAGQRLSIQTPGGGGWGSAP
jgi:N-methylhydantoinase B